MRPELATDWSPLLQANLLTAKHLVTILLLVSISDYEKDSPLKVSR
jgi:hypothetical protein